MKSEETFIMKFSILGMAEESIGVATFTLDTELSAEENLARALPAVEAAGNSAGESLVEPFLKYLEAKMREEDA